jgi:uncharacterized damage-inducible protein DinB
MIDRFRHWLTYEIDSHDKALASLRSVPAERRSEEPYQRALSIMGHVLAARQLWLFRLGQAVEAPSDFFPRGVTVDELGAQAEAVHAAWSAYLEHTKEDDLARIFEYRSLDNQGFRNSIEDVFTQLFGHSWYHRGQIAMLVRQAGGEPATTDFIYWTRRPIAT